MSISVIIIRVRCDPDDDDRDGHQNVGILRTPNAADSLRRLYQVHSPRKHQDLYVGGLLFLTLQSYTHVTSEQRKK
jgi:hypothetical protein